MSVPPTPSQQTPASRRDFRFRSTGIPCESAESCRPGGLHPVHFGDVLNGRYQVTRKLGYGSFATVWLAVDSAVSRYVAVKVQVAKLHVQRQLSIQRLLAAKALQDTDSQFINSPLDSFVLEGPNGKHLCLVLEPMGPSVSSIFNAPEVNYNPRNSQPRRFPKQQAKGILRTVLLGLRFLHSNGVVHGDLQSGNILFAIQDLSFISPERLRQDEGNSWIELLERIDGKVDKWAPSYLAVPMPLSEYVLKESIHVKIIDMDGAFLNNNPSPTIVTPAALRAPESILGCSVGNGIDIWSFGCLLFEFLTGMPLFQLPPLKGCDESMDDDHLIQLTDVIHPLPKSLISRWPRASKYYGPNGERLNARSWYFGTREESHGSSVGSDAEDDDEYEEFDKMAEEQCSIEECSPPTPCDSLEKLFRDNKAVDIEEEEERDIVMLLRSILQYDPLRRPSAADLLEHPWIKA